MAASEISSNVSAHSDDIATSESSEPPHEQCKRNDTQSVASKSTELCLEKKLLKICLEKSDNNEKLFVIRSTQNGNDNYSSLPTKPIAADTQARINKMCVKLSAIKRLHPNGVKIVNNYPPNAVSFIKSNLITYRRNSTSQSPNNQTIQPVGHAPARIQLENRRKTLHIDAVRKSNDLTGTFQPIIINSIDSTNKLPKIVAIIAGYQRTDVTEKCNNTINDSIHTNQSSSTPTTPPVLSGVKILSVNELNRRFDQMQPKTVKILPKPNEPEVIIPIHVSLIKRSTDDLELTFTMHEKTVSFESLSASQRLEVRRSLLDDDVWLKMLEHVKKGKPSVRTLTLFQTILPPEQSQHFFSQIKLSKPVNSNVSTIRNNIVL